MWTASPPPAAASIASRPPLSTMWRWASARPVPAALVLLVVNGWSDSTSSAGDRRTLMRKLAARRL